MSDLLDKIKQAPSARERRNSVLSDIDAVPVALSWLRGDIRVGQIATGMGFASHATASVYSVLARGMREAYRQGKLKIEEP